MNTNRSVFRAFALLAATECVAAPPVPAPFHAVDTPAYRADAFAVAPSHTHASVSPTKALASLGAFNVSPTQVSISGFSSGATMAGQVGIAYSSRFVGVGIFSGFPYDCARHMPGMACIYPNVPSIEGSRANMLAWSGNQIDPVSNIARQRIYAFTGTNDTNVGAAVTAQAVNLYRFFVSDSNIRFDNLHPFSHAFPTDRPDNPPCALDASRPMNCGFDGAGAALQWIHGPLNARNTGQLRGQLIEFDQREHVQAGLGMADAAWLYVPATCASGSACKLHVFLHGCLGSVALTGSPLFPRHAGFNEWADNNDIVVLYPQTSPDSPRFGDCWDMGGTYGSDYDQKNGVQIAAIMRMVARITGGSRAPAIEYHHAEWDHYFVTASSDEIHKLDAGVFAGWARTGHAFTVHQLGAPGAVDVCRFFSTSFAPRSSHFYTPFASECQNLRENADWEYEGPVFAIGLPDGSGACVPGTDPVYRLYNDGRGGAPNHRYSISLSVRSAMIDRGWVPEGLGANGVIGCAPR